MLMTQLFGGNFTQEVPSHVGSHYPSIKPSPVRFAQIEVLVLGNGVGLRRLSHFDGQPLKASDDWGYRRCMAALEARLGRRATWMSCFFRWQLEGEMMWWWVCLKLWYIHPPKKNPLHYQDPRGSAKTIFLDSLSACKDMQLQVPDFGEGTCWSWLKL